MLDEELSELCDVTDSVLSELVDRLLLVDDEDVDELEELETDDRDVLELVDIDELEVVDDDKDDREELDEEVVTLAIVELEGVDELCEELVDSSSYHRIDRRPDEASMSGFVVFVMSSHTY